MFLRLAMVDTGTGLRLHVRARSGYVDVATASSIEEYASVTNLLRAGPPGLAAAAAAAEGDGRELDPSEVGPAVPDPGLILCLGLNYGEHAVEGGLDAPPTWPECFIRGPGSVAGPYAALVRPALSERFDYEGELGVVIGKGGRYIPAEEAVGAIAGYVVLNDASARDWQRAGSQWTAGKNFEGSMPIGPEIVTADEADVSDAALVTKLNGEVMQSARISQMIVDIPRAIEFFSSFIKLRPGDVIATGTPGGVGFARRPPVWLNPGDVVEVSVEGVGTIRNRVVDEGDRPPGWRWRPGDS
ncbi:MAG: fumarylacetoacetate hydrolase family protein [Acidimicrobiales bacterium]